MSNHTIVDLNHDYCPCDDELLEWAKAMQLYMRSGDKANLPNGVEYMGFRHHSESVVVGFASPHKPDCELALALSRPICTAEAMDAHRRPAVTCTCGAYPRL